MTQTTALADPASSAPPLAKPLLRGWSHVISFGVVAALATVMVAVADAPVAERLTLVLYEFGTLSMFGVSAMYHRGRWSTHALAVWRRMDHSTIFLAIAGAYTPVAVGCLEGWHRVAVLAIAWTGALVGISLQWLPVHVPRAAFTAVYVIVGWSSLIAFPQLYHGMGPRGFALLLGGGVAYTLGAVVYAVKWPDPWPRVFGYHEVFHVLTVIGAALHLATIAFVVVPKF
jgi:hemolysin III